MNFSSFPFTSIHLSKKVSGILALCKQTMTDKLKIKKTEMYNGKLNYIKAIIIIKFKQSPCERKT